jgi:dissimilatory sulfite reductase (desulfoviridin) alpha/beta subunit
VLEEDKCNYCGRCTKACPVDSWENTPGYIVSFGGLFGNRVHKGEQIVPIIHDKETLYRVIDAAVDFFKQNANAGERFRLTIERIGEDKFEQVIKEAYNG